MGLSRQEYWSGLTFPPSGDLLDPGIELATLSSPALAGGFFTTSATWETPYTYTYLFYLSIHPSSIKHIYHTPICPGLLISFYFILFYFIKKTCRTLEINFIIL